MAPEHDPSGEAVTKPLPVAHAARLSRVHDAPPLIEPAATPRHGLALPVKDMDVGSGPVESPGEMVIEPLTTHVPRVVAAAWVGDANPTVAAMVTTSVAPATSRRSLFISTFLVL